MASPLYKAILSEETVADLLTYYNTHNDTAAVSANSAIFPSRRRVDCLPEELTTRVVRECQVTMSSYFVAFEVYNPRIYGQNYGITKPHRDASLDGRATHTLLIYLTDSFEGGVLSIKTPRTEKHVEVYGRPEHRHIVHTMEPRKGYGVLFQKVDLHYTDELISNSEKVIMLLDIVCL